MPYTEAEVAQIMADNDPTEAARILAAPKDPGTLRRRAQRDERVFGVIARGTRSYTDDSGREYGVTRDPKHQKQADAGYWRVGAAVRRDCLPLVIGEGGVVERIWEVLGWEYDDASKKWVADLGRQLDNDDLDRDYPDFPYRIGDPCPTRRGGAYRPETY